MRKPVRAPYARCYASARWSWPSPPPITRRSFKPAQREGYFFVGGAYDTVGGKGAAVGQMFVQYHAPVQVTQPYPVVMVHGTAQTGVNFLGTPDGRPGWVDRFVEKGFASTWSIRSGAADPATTRRPTAPMRALRRTTWKRSSRGQEIRPVPQAKLHTRWPAEPA